MSGTPSAEPVQAADATPGGARPRRWWPWIVVAGVLVVGAAAVLSSQFRPPADVASTRGAGPAAPAFEVPDLRQPDRTVSLADGQGRPVVLNFWASWCVPCRTEMPAFQAVHERLGDRVTFIGIDHQDSRDDALERIKQVGTTYVAGYDPSGKVGAKYGLYGMPTTVFISADGRIVGRRVGEMTASALEQSVAQLFDVRPTGSQKEKP
jgi:cytochrome c biogenesis protein CcmG/thiol:disulfide interchange protein DsbE